MARFRIGIFTWPGKSMSLRDIGSDISLHGARVSLKCPRAIQLEPWRGEIQQPGTWVIGPKPSD